VPETLETALCGVQVVYHLAGIRRATTRDEFMRVNAEGTRFVAQAMVAAKARRLVLVGSLAASGPSSDGRPRVEADPFSPEEWYGESKAEAEVIAFGFSKQLEVTSCRPARIIGPGDRENLTFFKLAKRGLVLKLAGPERRVSMVDVEDVVDQLLLQGDLPQASGEAFFCSSAEALTVEALMREAASVLNVRVRTVPLPESVLRGLGALADVISNATGRKLPLNRKLARQLLAPGWECSIEKAQRVLGYSPKRSVYESLRRSAESYVANGWL
jgi:nucleoside-diphosphate-sugar epimerase